MTARRTKALRPKPSAVTRRTVCAPGRWRLASARAAMGFLGGLVRAARTRIARPMRVRVAKRLAAPPRNRAVVLGGALLAKVRAVRMVRPSAMGGARVFRGAGVGVSWARRSAMAGQRLAEASAGVAKVSAVARPKAKALASARGLAKARASGVDGRGRTPFSASAMRGTAAAPVRMPARLAIVAAAAICRRVIWAMSRPVAPRILRAANVGRRESSQLAVPPAMPRPAIRRAARPTRVRKSAMRATKVPVHSAASEGVRMSRPALGNWALRVAAIWAGLQVRAQARRVLLRYMAPGDSRPAFCGRSAGTMTVGPRAKPSPRRSGSSAIRPATVTGAPERVIFEPVVTLRRSAADGVSQAVLGAGAPTFWPLVRIRWPIRGQLASTALSWTGTAGDWGLACAIDWRRVPVLVGP